MDCFGFSGGNSCSYCVVKSHPKAEPKALEVKTFQRLVDEAPSLGFDELYLTGGEPFLHPRIFDLLDYALPRIFTTVLTNATVLTPRRMDRLSQLPRENLSLQISVDSANPDLNDLYRGEGSWGQTMHGVDSLVQTGYVVRIGGTATPEANGQEAELMELFSEKGFGEGDVFTRPLIKRGFSSHGKELYIDRLLPEVCVDRSGVFWHPLSTDPDFLVTSNIFPFSRAVGLIRTEMERREREGIESFHYQ
jgi:MoaA/NifB/PqqE/SkfB family radical SAM enzyme